MDASSGFSHSSSSISRFSVSGEIQRHDVCPCRVAHPCCRWPRFQLHASWPRELRDHWAVRSDRMDAASRVFSHPDPMNRARYERFRRMFPTKTAFYNSDLAPGSFGLLDRLVVSSNVFNITTPKMTSGNAETIPNSSLHNKIRRRPCMSCPFLMSMIPSDK